MNDYYPHYMFSTAWVPSICFYKIMRGKTPPLYRIERATLPKNWILL